MSYWTKFTLRAQGQVIVFDMHVALLEVGLTPEKIRGTEAREFQEISDHVGLIEVPAVYR
jgi:hypothetical protein